MSTLGLSTRAALTRRRRTPVPAAPDNTADNCHACGHHWHGLGCGNSLCVCPSAWVDPRHMARQTATTAPVSDSRGVVGLEVTGKLLGPQIEETRSA